MNWIFIGTLLGSIVTSGHDTKEACEGRKVTLSEKGVTGQCVQMQRFTSSTGTISVCGLNGISCGETPLVVR